MWAETAFNVDALKRADYPFPEPKVKFAGAIIQKFRPRNGRASSAFQRWIDQLTSGLRQSLVPALAAAKMLDIQEFEAKIGEKPWTPILEMADFNGLIAHSQEHQVPVYALTPDLVNQRGAIWKQTEADMKRFETLFAACAEKVFALTS
jgi:hypothetical protein